MNIRALGRGVEVRQFNFPYSNHFSSSRQIVKSILPALIPIEATESNREISLVQPQAPLHQPLTLITVPKSSTPTFHASPPPASTGHYKSSTPLNPPHHTQIAQSARAPRRRRAYISIIDIRRLSSPPAPSDAASARYLIPYAAVSHSDPES